jgi:putative ABC transport system permease protein
MRSLRRFFTRLRNSATRRAQDERLRGEIDEHIALQTEENLRAGLSPIEARRQARLKFGGVEAMKQDYRAERGLPLIEDLLQDLRLALRVLRKSPGFTATAILTLALGIGANTAIFTVVNTVLLHPLPYPKAERIVDITRTNARDSIPMFTYWEQNNPGFEDLCAYSSEMGMNLESGAKPELLQVTKASRNYFRLFGANPLLGRTFTQEEDQPGGPEVLVVSHSLWQRRFDGDPSVIGKSVSLSGTSYKMIGVLSPGFKPPQPTDAWLPLQADPASTNQAHILMVSGRLPEYTTLAQANAQIKVLGKGYVESHSRQLGNDEDLRVTPMQQYITSDVRSPLMILLGAVGLVLLIACVNVANLLLARATGRQKEIAIRAAIGAGRGRIARQLFAESMVLAVAGGGVGLALGSWGVRALLVIVPQSLPRLGEMKSIAALDPRIAGFTLLLALATGILFGVFPALQLSRIAPGAWLQESSGRAGSSRKHTRTRSVLVGAEVAMAIALLCGAMLLMRSFAAMHHVSLGFDPHNLLTMEFSLVGSGYAKSSEVDRLAHQFAERAERIPGVESAAMANSLPLWGTQDMIFDIPGSTALAGYKFTGDVQWRFVSAHYFDVLRIPLISGRLLRNQERGTTVVINQAMGRKYWPNANPVGQTIFLGAGLGPKFEEGAAEIVGVVGDVREQLNGDAPPTMYQTPAQIPDAAMSLINGLQTDAIMVRTRPGVAPMSVSEAVQDALISGGQLAATRIRTMEDAELGSTQQQNFNLVLFGLFAAVALILAAVGIYGVMSYSVEQRTQEIGLRAALGANRADILTLVLLQSLRATCVGIAAGIAGSLGLARLLSAQLFGVKATDPLTFVSVPAILLAVALVAAYLPARRAVRVDPIVALRYE